MHPGEVQPRTLVKANEREAFWTQTGRSGRSTRVESATGSPWSWSHAHDFEPLNVGLFPRDVARTYLPWLRYVLRPQTQLLECDSVRLSLSIRNFDIPKLGRSSRDIVSFRKHTSAYCHVFNTNNTICTCHWRSSASSPATETTSRPSRAKEAYGEAVCFCTRRASTEQRTDRSWSHEASEPRSPGHCSECRRQRATGALC